MNKKQLIVVWVMLILLVPNFCYSEDSDSEKMVDSQGNVYSVDKEGAIYTDGVPHPNRQPASVENLAYYFNQSAFLEVNGYLEEAIKMYYEILCLPEVNESVVNAKRGISLRIKKLYDNKETRDLVLQYFDVKGIGEGNFEVFPRVPKQRSGLNE